LELSRREMLIAAMASAVAGKAAAGALPQVHFGKWKVSRLIVGGNPVSGNSHVSGQLSREMTDYFTAARVKQLLSSCEEAGINTWQSRGDRHIMRLLNEYRLEGGCNRPGLNETRCSPIVFEQDGLDTRGAGGLGLQCICGNQRAVDQAGDV